MAFDPDKYLAEKNSAPKDGGFDPDKYLAEKSAQSGPQDRPVEAFTQGFGNAASFGYLPQIQAATEPAIQGVMDYFGGDDTDQKLKEQGFKIEDAPEESYVQRRDKFVRQGEQLKEENPYASMAGGVSGSLASGIATGGGLNSLMGTSGKVLSAGQRFKQAAGTGAIIGGARNPGDTEGEVDPLQLEDRAKNAAKDAATGLVIQGGLEGVKKGATAVVNTGKNLKTWSQNKALKSAGYMKKDFERAFGKKKTAELGQTIIDDNLAGLGDDIADVAKKSESALKSSGAKIGAVYDKADDVASLSKGDIKGLNNDFIEESSKRLDGTIDGEEVAQKIDKVLSVVNGQSNPTFGQLRKLRASIDDKINFAKETKDLPAYQEELLHLRNKVNDLVQKKIGETSPALKKELIKENKKYSQLADISKISRKKMAGEEANAAYGLRERISGGVGGVIGGAVGGIPGAIAGGVIGSLTTKAARQYGTPFVAITANKVAKALEKNKDAIGKFSKPLLEAAHSPEKFVATVNSLMKDPEFKKKVNQPVEMDTVYRGPAKGGK